MAGLIAGIFDRRTGFCPHAWISQPVDISQSATIFGQTYPLACLFPHTCRALCKGGRTRLRQQNRLVHWTDLSDARVIVRIMALKAIALAANLGNPLQVIGPENKRGRCAAIVRKDDLPYRRKNTGHKNAGKNTGKNIGRVCNALISLLKSLAGLHLFSQTLPDKEEGSLKWPDRRRGVAMHERASSGSRALDVFG